MCKKGVKEQYTFDFITEGQFDTCFWLVHSLLKDNSQKCLESKPYCWRELLYNYCSALTPQLSQNKMKNEETKLS